MKRMSRVQAFNALRDAVNERGRHFLYDGSNGCRNVNANNEPDCMVGLALWRFGEQNGLPKDFMLDYRSGTAPTIARDMKRAGVLDISKPAIVLLKVAQRYQDEGKTWGEAFNAMTLVFDAMDAVKL